MMKTAIRLLVIVSIFIIAISLSACEIQREQSLEEKYNIKNYSAVFFENDSTEFNNYGKGTDETTVFELASNGKTIAAYIALAMVDEGILDINEKISPYLDSELLTDDIRLDEITLNQLLSHTAGFSPNFELGTDKKIYSDPGTEFCYSGVGYIYRNESIRADIEEIFDKIECEWNGGGELSHTALLCLTCELLLLIRRSKNEKKHSLI